MKGVFITGTDTDIGKTWVGVRLINALVSKNINVIPRKPVESGWNHANIEKTDAWKLANAANKLQQLDEICPNRFSQIASPVRAANSEGQSLSIEELTQQCLQHKNQTSQSNNFLYIEGAGGFYSPLAKDGLNKDLATALNLPIILVAENRLGCINQILLASEAIKNAKLDLVAIVLNQVSININRRDKETADNLSDIKSYLDTPVIPIRFKEKSNLPFIQLADILFKNT